MKHSRNEVLKYNIGSYMKRRHFSENDHFQKSDFHMMRNISYLTLASVVDNESSQTNSVVFSCVNNDPSVVECQFSKLRCWINELSPLNVRDELKSVLFPLLFHLYLEMIRGGHKIAASTLLNKNQCIGNDDETVRILAELATLENAKDIEDKNIMQNLRSSKFELKIASSTLEILKNYLLSKSHIMLFQIINGWFELEDDGLNNAAHDENIANIIQSCNGFSDIQSADGDLVKLEEIIRLVNEVPPSSSPLLLYGVLNPENCMSCGRMSQDTFQLAAGFNTSEIKLWSLTETKLVCHKPCSSSRVRLAVDIEEPDAEVASHKLLPTTDNITLKSHSGSIRDLAFMPEHKLLLSVSMDKTMRAWDLKTHSCRATYSGHNYPIWAVDVSPMGVYAATASHDKTARLWSLERNYPLRIFAGHVQDVDCLRFHPNGSYLATGSSDKSVRLWSTNSGEVMRVLPGHRGGVYTLSFSPDGKFLASAGEDKRVKIWELTTSNIVTELKGHSSTVISLDWSADGEFLASCSLDNTCRVWHVKSFSSDDSTVQQLPAIYTLNCNSLFSVKYSQQNTPICVAGV